MQINRAQVNFLFFFFDITQRAAENRFDESCPKNSLRNTCCTRLHSRATLIAVRINLPFLATNRICWVTTNAFNEHGSNKDIRLELPLPFPFILFWFIDRVWYEAFRNFTTWRCSISLRWRFQRENNTDSNKMLSTNTSRKILRPKWQVKNNVREKTECQNCSIENDYWNVWPSFISKFLPTWMS